MSKDIKCLESINKTIFASNRTKKRERGERVAEIESVCFTVSKTCQIRQCTSRANAHEGSVTKTMLAMIMSSARIEKASWVISFALNI